MQLHTLSLLYRRKRTKRVGRGGKRGTYSGRGQKGQRARAGRRIRPAERELLMRIPKRRGVKHKRRTLPAIAVSVGLLERKLKDTTVTRETLLEAGFIPYVGAPVKILAGGEVCRAFTVRGIPASAAARKKIAAAGGSVE